jgi:hypothetical protein
VVHHRPLGTRDEGQEYKWQEYMWMKEGKSKQGDCDQEFQIVPLPAKGKS